MTQVLITVAILACVPGLPTLAFLFVMEARPLHWLRVAWSPAPDVPASETPDKYPSGNAEFALEIALSALTSQDAQIGALDGKLGVIAGVGATVGVLIPAVLALDTQHRPMEPHFAIAALACFIAAILHGLWGMRIQTYAGVPELDAIRKLFDEDYEPSDAQWAAFVTVEQSVRANEFRLPAKTAAFRIGWWLVLAGVVLVTVATIFSRATW